MLQCFQSRPTTALQETIQQRTRRKEFQRSLRNTFRPAIEVVVPIERNVCVNAF